MSDDAAEGGGQPASTASGTCDSASTLRGERRPQKERFAAVRLAVAADVMLMTCACESSSIFGGNSGVSSFNASNVAVGVRCDVTSVSGDDTSSNDVMLTDPGLKLSAVATKWVGASCER